MAAGKLVGKIFGMFDKIDDIVYEPVKLVCDALRQPLKQIDIHNEKAKEAHTQELKKQMEQFELDLEQDKKRREMELSVDQKRMEEEINQMILDNDMHRREEMVQLEMKYRKEMAEAATKLAAIMANMQADTRSRILTLYTEKTNEYLGIQQKFEDNLYSTVDRMKKLFPGEKGDEKIMEYTFKQLDAIAERSSDFVKSLNADMTKVLGGIDITMSEMNSLAGKYFMPAEPNQKALTQNVVDANTIEG